MHNEKGNFGYVHKRALEQKKVTPDLFPSPSKMMIDAKQILSFRIFADMRIDLGKGDFLVCCALLTLPHELRVVSGECFPETGKPFSIPEMEGKIVRCEVRRAYDW